MSRQSNLDAVLRWANAVRLERGLGEPLTEIPKGRILESCACPLARALGTDVAIGLFTADFTLPGEEDDIIELPEAASDFIRAFDAGAYPELIEAAA